MLHVEELTEGSVTLGPCTLYTSIKRLLAAGLIQEAGERPDSEMDDQRRRYYKLYKVGSQSFCGRSSTYGKDASTRED
jgi:DNA-binding PadR family transcriptional regulator